MEASIAIEREKEAETDGTRRAKFRRMRAAGLLVVCLLVGATSVVGGCAQKRATPVAKSANPMGAPAPASPPLANEATQNDQVKKPRFGEATVYVDGKTVGVLRFPELPASCKPKVVKTGGGYDQINYSINDYLTGVGVDTTKVKGLHLYGGKRAAVLDEAAYKRLGDRLEFSYLQRDRGKVRMEWPAAKLGINTTIDILTGIAVYVEKTPPHIEKYDLVMPDGTRVEDKVPYADLEQGNGTRVYVDGALVSTVKRKKLTNDIVVPANDIENHFSLAGYAKSVGVADGQARAIDLVAGDDVVGRYTADTVRDVSFAVPRHNQGKILVDLKADDAHTMSQQAKVSAVQIYVKTAPPSRKIIDPSTAPEAKPGGGNGGGGGGSNDDATSGKNAGADDDGI
jgi:hypothetical protein